MVNTKTEYNKKGCDFVGGYARILGYDNIDLVRELRDLITGEFVVKLKVSDFRNTLYINNRACVSRPGKFKKIKIHGGTKLLEGTDLGYGGSNSYPAPAFKEGYCIIAVRTKGFPQLSEYNYQHKIEVLSIDKI